MENAMQTLHESLDVGHLIVEENFLILPSFLEETTHTVHDVLVKRDARDADVRLPRTQFFLSRLLFAHYLQSARFLSRLVNLIRHTQFLNLRK